MKNWSVFFAAVFLTTTFVMSPAWGGENNSEREAYFDFNKPVVEDITHLFSEMELRAQPGLGEDCNRSGKKVYARRSSEPIGKDFNPLEQVEAIVDRLINIGQKVWSVVLAGKPVVDTKLQTANALPEGLNCWVDLQGWQVPQTRVYRIQYRNGFGSNVVDFAFRVSFTAGGSASGIGRYIANATMMAANLDVAWGYQFGAMAEVPSVLNVGTEMSPVAGMQMVMRWTVDTPLKHSEATETFFVTGDNQLQRLP